MGTYSQPSRILDTSLSKVGETFQTATSNAMKAIRESQVKEEKKLLEEQKRIKKEQLEAEKKPAKLGAEATEAVGKIDKYTESGSEHARLVPQVNAGNIRIGIGESGVGYMTQEEQDTYNHIMSGKDDNEKMDRLDNSNMSMSRFEQLQKNLEDEIGVSVEDQLKASVVGGYNSLAGINEASDEYQIVKRTINSDMQEGLNLLGYMNKATQLLQPGTPNSPYKEDGTIVLPAAGKSNVLLFSDDPQQEMLINAMRDYSFGVNTGRFSYMNGDNGDPYIQYTYEGKNYNITSDELQKAISRHGGGLVNVTDKETYDKYLDGVKSIAESEGVNFKGLVKTYRTTFEQDGKKVTSTQKYKDFEEQKKKLRQAIEKDVEINGLRSANGEKIYAQNIWQMSGGPDEADRGTWAWKDTEEQKKKLVDQIYFEMEKAFFSDEEVSNTFNSREIAEGKANAAKEYKTQNAFSFTGDSGLAEYVKGGDAVLKKDKDGSYNLGLEGVVNSWDMLKADNMKGAIEFLNHYNKGTKFASGKDLGITQAQDSQGKTVKVKPGTIYEKTSQGKYVERNDLQDKRTYILELVGDAPGGLTTKMAEEIMAGIDEDNETAEVVERNLIEEANQFVV